VISETLVTREPMAKLFMNVDVRLLAAAERELGAFLTTVGESIGPEFIEQAAEQWIKGLSYIKEPCEAKEAFWRRATISACAQLSGAIQASASGVAEYSTRLLHA
jgi:hypothetical protein